MQDIFFFSSNFLLTLNLRVLKKLSLVHAFSDIMFTWSVHVNVLEKVRPKCLWLVLS